MKLYSSNKDYKLYHGNMLDMLEVIEKESIDSIVTDPPYELNFMGKGWDNSGIAFQKETWQKCYEVLKPGGYLLAFGGSRTFHRIACAIEDAGFEIRDTIMWLYGSGFPKSMALDKALEGKLTLGNANTQVFRKLNGELVDRGNYGYASVAERQGARPNDYNLLEEQRLGKLNATTELAKKYSGWGTALKPSFEPIIVARKPFKGSLVDNVIEYGVGGINIDECRVETNEDLSNIKPIGTMPSNKVNGVGFTRPWMKDKNAIIEKQEKAIKKLKELGRFPANTILTYDETDFDEVCGGFPNNTASYRKGNRDSRKAMFDFGSQDKTNQGYTDSGSASRYFYCAKASKKDRDEGLDDFVATTDKAKGNGLDRVCEFCGVSQLTPELCHCETKSWITKPKKNTHPTVKPTELMQYLVRLVTPNNGTILDPFNGSGSTGKAVMYENKERNKNYKYIGIELTEEYLPISKARIEYICNLKPEINPQISIFDLEEKNE